MIQRMRSPPQPAMASRCDLSSGPGSMTAISSMPTKYVLVPWPVMIPELGATIRRTSGLRARATPGVIWAGGAGASSLTGRWEPEDDRGGRGRARGARFGVDGAVAACRPAGGRGTGGHEAEPGPRRRASTPRMPARGGGKEQDPHDVRDESGPGRSAPARRMRPPSSSHGAGGGRPRVGAPRTGLEALLLDQPPSEHADPEQEKQRLGDSDGARDLDDHPELGDRNDHEEQDEDGQHASRLPATVKGPNAGGSDGWCGAGRGRRGPQLVICAGWDAHRRSTASPARIADVGLPHPLLVEAARAAIAEGRADGAREHADRLARTLLQRVVNATGVLLHTNLGRAPWRITREAYSNLELDLDTGQRRRSAHTAALMGLACGAEAALVVQRRRGGLSRGGWCGDRGVAVSRGELAEIGGGSGSRGHGRVRRSAG